jgi:hypothetical protein
MTTDLYYVRKDLSHIADPQNGTLLKGLPQGPLQGTTTSPLAENSALSASSGGLWIAPLPPLTQQFRMVPRLDLRKLPLPTRYVSTMSLVQRQSYSEIEQTRSSGVVASLQSKA